MPSPQSHARISDAQLEEAVRNTALHLSRHRKAELLWNLPALDYLVPSGVEEMNLDWRHAAILVATAVLHGRLRLSDLQPQCYPRLEGIWLDEVKENLAYFRWINSREEVGFWTPDSLREEHYAQACSEIRNLLIERKNKDRLENFGSVREYIRERYLDEFQRYNGEYAASLTQSKAARLWPKAAPQFATALAAEYSQKFYENIIPAVEACDRDACIAVLRALQHGGSLPGFAPIATCFEATIAVSFLDATTIQELWKTAPNISRDTTF